MKIIDLLNKIANDEEVPKEIKYNNIDYFWCKQCKIYERFEDDRKDLYNDLENLNDEVEIIEEDKKIEKLEYKYINTYGNVSQHRKSEEPIIDKINELIDKVNNMENNK